MTHDVHSVRKTRRGQPARRPILGLLRSICLAVAILSLAALSLSVLTAPAVVLAEQTPTMPPDSLQVTLTITPGQQLPDSLPNGIASGDVTQTSAVLWARSTITGTGAITFAYGTDLNAGPTEVVTDVVDDLLPVKVKITGLMTDTAYQYRVTTAAGDSLEGKFRTHAALGQQTGLRFGAAGDWNSNDEVPVYPVLKNVADRDLDFFIGLGDSVYSDISSNPAMTLDEYRLKHSLIYSGFFGLNANAALRANTSILATIDDHEIVNDFAGGADASTDSEFTETSGFINDAQRYENGMQAFHDYHPIAEEKYGNVGDSRLDDEWKLYRYLTYGRDAAVIVIDQRSFRDSLPSILPAALTITNTNSHLADIFSSGRTMLGAAQLNNLKNDLLDAHQKGITWKFVAGSMLIQSQGQGNIPNRFEGYGLERAELLKFIDDNKISNVVFISADIHGHMVNDLSYRTSATSTVTKTEAFEVTTGAVSASDTYGSSVSGFAAFVLNLISLADYGMYSLLPIVNDMDTTIDDKDDFMRNFFNERITFVGHDPIGLDGALVDATLHQGDYIAIHSVNWTEFEIDATTQVLTVTTYGVPSFGPTELLTATTYNPTVVGQFSVKPKTYTRYFPIIFR